MTTFDGISRITLPDLSTVDVPAVLVDGRIDIVAPQQFLPIANPDDELIVTLPRWAWDGIVNGIEKWSGRQAGDIQILDAAVVAAASGEYDALYELIDSSLEDALSDTELTAAEVLATILWDRGARVSTSIHSRSTEDE